VLNTLTRSIRRRGLIDTARHAAALLGDWWEPHGLANRFRRWEIARFDCVHGVQTAGPMSLDRLAICGERASGTRYESMTPRATRKLLAGLDIDYREWTLVDAGSGKGRVLLVAAGFPFREVIGVEYARELHLRALTNLDSDRLAGRRACGNVRSVWCDAAEFLFPPGPIVLYVANPFGPDVLRRVLINLTGWPREVQVIHLMHREATAEFGRLYAEHGLIEYQSVKSAGHYLYRLYQGGFAGSDPVASRGRTRWLRGVGPSVRRGRCWSSEAES
jgi:hypothetical protein